MSSVESEILYVELHEKAKKILNIPHNNTQWMKNSEDIDGLLDTLHIALKVALEDPLDVYSGTTFD